MTAVMWEAFPEDLEPIAPRTGPFPNRPFLETVWEHRDETESELHIEVVSQGAVALAATKDLIEFAGQSNLSDYHSPLGSSGAKALANAMAAFPGATFRFDSLPAEATEAVEAAAAMVGADYTTAQHDVAAVLELPDSYDDWLASIGKKERHEVRRKRRRFEAEFGRIEMVSHGSDAIDMFSAMHRTSHGHKGTFMTGGMQRYFEDLLDSSDAAIHTLVCDGIPRASAFGFETEDGYFYYNSAFDIDAAMASPGIVLLALMIESQIERGARVFDFLKGGERYKFKHGAKPRPLFAVTGRIP
ncbi:MAG: hypothetical protein BMS9Abin20_0335 [Acidimicrobiia bacterium]|nr:MAG: hypothetical protein BMS9Abin20_0335 [Acidimicrobiia bacterium]